MQLTTEKTGARPWDEAHLKELFGEGFPEFVTADRLVKNYIGRVWEFFADLDLMLVDEDGVPVASGWGVPVRWDGRPESLPSGYTEALVRAVEGHEQGVAHPAARRPGVGRGRVQGAERVDAALLTSFARGDGPDG
ncbi:hypothetical protein ACFY91_19015 [Streptomyces albogriseolus]|uniref:hypothetical protein n=1 Tax=Streptomyces albogriseolus TaxID=1887 RepID=UPI0036E41455